MGRTTETHVAVRIVTGPHNGPVLFCSLPDFILNKCFHNTSALQTDRQTDWRTEFLQQYRAMHSCAMVTRDKNDRQSYVSWYFYFRLRPKDCSTVQRHLNVITHH